MTYVNRLTKLSTVAAALVFFALTSQAAQLPIPVTKPPVKPAIPAKPAKPAPAVVPARPAPTVVRPATVAPRTTVPPPIAAKTPAPATTTVPARQPLTRLPAATVAPRQTISTARQPLTQGRQPLAADRRFAESATGANNRTALYRRPLLSQGMPASPTATPGSNYLNRNSLNRVSNQPGQSSVAGQPGAGGPSAQQAQAGAARDGVSNSAQGVGTFAGCCGYNLTAYSCFRSGDKVLCDYDVTNSGNANASANSIYGDMSLVNQSGRPLRRSRAYFVDSDGSHFDSGKIASGTTVRMVMEFDNVPSSFGTVSMHQGSTHVDNLAISAQEPGTETAEQPQAQGQAQPPAPAGKSH